MQRSRSAVRPVSPLALALPLALPFAAMVAAASCGLAQEPGTRAPLDGRAFVPLEPGCEVWVDFEAMRRTEVWEGITRSFAGTLLPMAEQGLGFRLDELQWLRGYPPTRSEGANDDGVVIFQGSEQVVTPAGRPGTRLDTIAGHEVVIVEDWRDEDPTLWVSPRQGVVVYGARHLIEPVLAGERQPGVTPPELLSLSAGRGVLAHIVMACNDEVKQGFERLLASGSAAGEAANPSAPDFLMLRLRHEAATDDHDATVHLDARLRWTAAAGEESAAMAAYLQAQIEGLRKHPRLGALKRVWNTIEVGVDGRDTTAHIDLGRPRDAGAIFAMLAPLMMMGTADAAPQAIPAQVGQPAPADARPDEEPEPAEPAGEPQAPPRKPGGG